MKPVRTAVPLAAFAAGLALVCGCPSMPTGGGDSGAGNVNGNANQNANDNGNGGGTPAALPAKTITFNLIGIHDPDSESYNGDCIGCHGDRTNEVSLDGTTPAAHGTMLALFGEGNDRCRACHESGPDFLTASAGGLREQVDMPKVGCASCHGAAATPAFYAE